MKFEPFNCPKCGLAARGTVESLSGVAEFNDADEEGNVEYSGNTEVFWDGQMTETDEEGNVALVCLNGDEWYAKMEDPN